MYPEILYACIVFELSTALQCLNYVLTMIIEFVLSNSWYLFRAHLKSSRFQVKPMSRPKQWKHHDGDDETVATIRRMLRPYIKEFVELGSESYPAVDMKVAPENKN